MSPAIAQTKKRLLSIFYADYVYVISRNGRRGGEKLFKERLKAAEKRCYAAALAATAQKSDRLSGENWEMHHYSRHHLPRYTAGDVRWLPSLPWKFALRSGA